MTRADEEGRAALIRSCWARARFVIEAGSWRNAGPRAHRVDSHADRASGRNWWSYVGGAITVIGMHTV